MGNKMRFIKENYLDKMLNCKKYILRIKKVMSSNPNIMIYTCSVVFAVGISSFGIYRAEKNKASIPVPTTASANVENTNKESEMADLAESYFYECQYEKAVEEYEKLSQEYAFNPIWPVKIAEIYSIQGNIESSNIYLKKSKEIREKNSTDIENIKLQDQNYEKKDAEAANYIIFTEYMNRNFKEALEYGEKALEVYPKNKKLIMTMIPVYLANKNMDMAKQLIEKYPIDTNSSYDVAKLAYLNILVDKWDVGLDLLKISWDIDTDEYKVFDVLAHISKYNKDMLLEKVTQLSEAKPDEPAYKMWLAKIYSMREETVEMAQSFWNEAAPKDTGNFMKVVIQARIYQNSNKIAEADELINKIIEDGGDDYRILHTVSLFYFEKGNYEKALEYCKRSIQKNKQYPDNYGFLMTDILKAMGKSNEGEPYFRTALYLEPYNYNIIHAIANYYWHTAENTEKALEYFDFYEIVRPYDPEIKYSIASIHTANGNFDQAIVKLKECIEIDTSVPKYHRTLGTIYMQQEKFDLGIAEIRNAYQADKGDILALNNAGCYYIMVEGDVVRGRYNLEKAAEGITDSVDEYTKQTIKENLQKAEDIYEKFNSGKSDEVINVPEFKLFY
ncbi:tetratricopeptide repeat protein [Clostridium thermarum]|uniref:tetratricopeptide repeat protein n=1 Tax=Clostridium thermarum TaxID=1716543 RepID=UPI0013D719D2|nr:tetratricopeptide repeat protein [Clostridium thermarum]